MRGEGNLFIDLWSAAKDRTRNKKEISIGKEISTQIQLIYQTSI
jgi:predicted XRE-type DNA-binding protein